MIEKKNLPCPCCGFLTIPDDGTFPGSFYTCPVCHWEDDDIQFDNPDLRGGANKMSLNEAMKSFKEIGAKGPASVGYVRAPLPEEKE